MNFFGKSGGPSGTDPAPQAMARIEMEVVSEMFYKMSNSCFKKCVTRYGEPDPLVGELTCVDRCIYKYLQAGELVEKTVKQHESQMAAFEKSLAETNSKFGVK